MARSRSRTKAKVKATVEESSTPISALVMTTMSRTTTTDLLPNVKRPTMTTVAIFVERKDTSQNLANIGKKFNP